MPHFPIPLVPKPQEEKDSTECQRPVVELPCGNYGKFSLWMTNGSHLKGTTKSGKHLRDKHFVPRLFFIYTFLFKIPKKSCQFAGPTVSAFPQEPLGYSMWKYSMPRHCGSKLEPSICSLSDIFLTDCVVSERIFGGLNPSQCLHFSFLTWQSFRETLLSAIS